MLCEEGVPERCGGILIGDEQLNKLLKPVQELFVPVHVKYILFLHLQMLEGMIPISLLSILILFILMVALSKYQWKSICNSYKSIHNLQNKSHLTLN